MANRYAVAGISLATAATADHCAALLFNPHASKSIYVREVHAFSNSVATLCHPSLVRTSTAGTTPTATVTPDADNAFDRRAVPASGALLYGGTWSAQPTLQTPYLLRSTLPAAIGAAVMWSFLDEAIEVPFGTGLAIATPVAVVLQPLVYSFVWDE